MSTLDIDVTGRSGLYAIRAVSRRGRAWRKRHLTGGERTVVDDAVMCEGGDHVRDIVAGAVADGLTVQVNGVDMKGFRRTA